jgi:hypothetical protein
MRRLLALVVALALTGIIVAQENYRLRTVADFVKVAAESGKPDAAGKQVITLTLDIDKEWFLYANPVGNDILESVQTVVSVTGKKKPADVKIEYPPGIEMTSFGESYRVYKNKAVIKATVRRAEGDTDPLEVSVCCDGSNMRCCYPPGTKRLRVP